MSTEEHNIEKRIKDKFENHDFEIQNAWLEDMSDKLDAFNEKPKRKFGFWIFFLGGLLLGSAVGGYWYTNSSFTKENKFANIETNILVQEKNALQNSEKNTSNSFYTEEICADESINEKHNLEILEANTKNAAKENSLSKNKQEDALQKSIQNNIAAPAKNMVAINNTTQNNLESSSSQNEETNLSQNNFAVLKTTKIEVFHQEKDGLLEENKNENISKEVNTLNSEVKTETKSSENN